MDQKTDQRTSALGKPIRAVSLPGALLSGALSRGGFRTQFLKTLLPLALLSLAASPGQAGSLNSLSAEILGQVRNGQGVAQMGAAVYLYNRYDQLVGRGLSNEQGRFVFDGLIPDVYSVRVLLASFIPAERRNIAVLPSTENRLDINLTSVISTVQLASSPFPKGGMMSDDWKWVLRASQATRPVLRFLPVSSSTVTSSPSTSSSDSARATLFSNPSGLVKFSSGEGETLSGGTGQDMGTAFALAASLAGTARVQLSGNVGYSVNSPLPAAGIRSTYSRTPRDGASHSLFVVSVRQIYLAPQAGQGASMPVLRTMSAAYLDRLDLTNALSFDYGVAADSVAYVHRASNVSPFVRATYTTGHWGRLRVGANSGSQPTELITRDRETSISTAGNLDQDLAALWVLPTVSRSSRNLTMQRNQNIELGWDKVAGSRTYSAAAYDEVVSNAAFLLSSPSAAIPVGDLLADLNSNSSIFNVGSYHRTGYTAAVKQTVGTHAEFSLAAGRTGALLANSEGGDAQSQTLRAGIRTGQRNWATARVTGIVPHTGTRVSADYGWTDFHVLMPAHLFTIQDTNQDIGANVRLRQPIPVNGMPWRMEATVEMRNMLAQGYVPLGGTASQSVLTASPRALRGGLNIIF